MRAVRPYTSKHVFNQGGYPSFTPANWRYGAIDADTIRGPQTIRAEVMEDFAVHRMIGTPGYTIAHAPTGFRMESRERVFKTIEWAKHVAERLHPISNNWAIYAEGWPFPEITIKHFNYIFDVAEHYGAFREELIPAPERVRRMPTLEF